MKAVRKLWKRKPTKTHRLNTISIVSFLQARLFTEKFSRTSTVHPGIFLRRALGADIVSPGDTNGSHKQFKPILGFHPRDLSP